mmetsp:Transcript_24076/g.75298  ORF Transcript_24076/g.75298 Transcript_24076/m.75298 type:complete len:281 (-) Transcript_24076:239-1081(-)
MRRAERDPIVFFVKNKLGLSGIPGKTVPTRDLLRLLEAWVGHRADQEIKAQDDIREILQNASTAPSRDDAAVHELVETRKMPHVKSNRVKNLLLSFKASPFDPIIALDRNVLALVLRVFSRYYLSSLDKDCRTVPSRRRLVGFGHRRHHHVVQELSRPGAHRVAINILARFGTVADLNSDGVISADEAAAIRNLIYVLPQVVDEAKTAESRLAYAYNVACSAPPERRPRPDRSASVRAIQVPRTQPAPPPPADDPEPFDVVQLHVENDPGPHAENKSDAR